MTVIYSEETTRKCSICKSVWTPDDPEYATMVKYSSAPKRLACGSCNSARVGAYFKTAPGLRTAARAAAKRAAAPGRGVTAREKRDLISAYGRRCLCCGRYEGEVTLVADHIVPLAKGGLNEVSNCQSICFSCNSSKSARHSTDYRPDGGALARCVGARDGAGLPTVGELVALFAKLNGEEAL